MTDTTEKYYTPTLDEFHVGFEFQLLNHRNEWVDCDLDQKEIYHKGLEEYPDDLMKLAHAITRVKFLDREDIESLGFPFIEAQDKGNVLSFRIPPPEGYYESEEVYWMINLYPATGGIWIGNNQTYEDCQCVFSGTIRNKSELARILKQTGVIK